MKLRSALAAIALSVVLIAPAAPASATFHGPRFEGCMATLLVGSELSQEARPTSSRAILGNAVARTKVRVVAVDASGAYSFKIEAWRTKNGIRLTDSRFGEYSVAAGYVQPQGVAQTWLLRLCLATKF